MRSLQNPAFYLNSTKVYAGRLEYITLKFMLHAQILILEITNVFIRLIRLKHIPFFELKQNQLFSKISPCKRLLMARSNCELG